MIAHIIVIALVFAAPGEIHRCIGADGKVGFQDKPCATANGSRFKAERGARADDPNALRAWLQGLRRQGEASAPGGRRPPIEMNGSTTGVVDEERLAACSERFLACADDSAARMDACVTRIAACTASTRTSCCPRECVARYQRLRADGAALADAVRNALLDSRRTSCATR
jgi:hypothetical protein